MQWNMYQKEGTKNISKGHPQRTAHADSIFFYRIYNLPLFPDFSSQFPQKTIKN